jgi:trimethylguanosine synthase
MRRELFTRFGEGVQLDEIGLIGVKPEAAALSCASRLPGRTALDAFAGVGGCAIALARTGKRVLSLDVDMGRLRMARHNAGVYGVAGRILFARADARSLVSAVRVDAIYLDPPWGGMQAAERPRFGLADFRPSAEQLLPAALAAAPSVVLAVPPNFDLSELDRYRPDLVCPVIRAGEILYSDVFFLR